MKKERRKVLKKATLGAAGVLAGMQLKKWEKPVIDSVVVPAHAQMTDKATK